MLSYFFFSKEYYEKLAYFFFSMIEISEHSHLDITDQKLINLFGNSKTFKKKK